jgi:hypothetical protein
MNRSVAFTVCYGEDLAIIRQRSFTKGDSPELPPFSSFHITLQLIELHPSSKWRHRYSQAKNSRVRSYHPQVCPCFAVILIVSLPASSFFKWQFHLSRPFRPASLSIGSALFALTSPPRQLLFHTRLQISFTTCPTVILPPPADLDSERTNTQQNSFSFMPESSGSAGAATLVRGGRTIPAAADKDSPPVVEGGEDCTLNSRNRGRGSQGAKKRARATTCEGGAVTTRHLGTRDGEEALESEFDGADLVTPVLRIQRGGGDAALRSSENRALRLNQRHVCVPPP